MCLLAVQYRLVPESPILVAANREEYIDRPSLPPSIQSGKPRVLCGIDQKAGGSWLGVNQNGLFVGLCNRATATPLFGQRSRGLLALDLLRCTSASRALEKAETEFAKTRYDGCNILIADAKNGYAIHADERQEGVEIRLMNPDGETGGSTIRVRAHRDELIALELELAGPLDLASDGSLLSSPI